MRRLQLFVGLILATGAFALVFLIGQLSQAPKYEVAVVVQEIPAYTLMTEDMIVIDSQSVSAMIADTYVLADEWRALLAAGAVSAENLHPGQPLLRANVASGAEAHDLSRLAVALADPDQVILSVPVIDDELPATVPGDVVALFFSAGSVHVTEMTTTTVDGLDLDTDRSRTSVGLDDLSLGATEGITFTTLDLPLSKWIASGVVYRLNWELRENPNYGAPGMEQEPRYIEGELKSLDIVVGRTDAEWIAFALAHGDIRVAVLPAITRPDVEAGTMPPETGVTWTDFERRFFEEREVAQ
jgi:hypothetical protein